MAKKTENSSSFNLIAGLIALCLIVAAGLTYFQSSGASSTAPELAALSQALPMQAAEALAGTSGAFDELQKSTDRLTALRREGAPGRASDWQQLESSARTITCLLYTSDAADESSSV